jgi:hypothetical protein
MQLTVEKIIVAKQALGEFDKKALPAKLSYWLGRLEDKLNPISKRFEKEKNNLIIEKYGKKVEGTESFQVPEENIEAYTKDVLTILDQKEEIDISIRLELFDGVEVSKEFFISLGELIKENGTPS